MRGSRVGLALFAVLLASTVEVHAAGLDHAYTAWRNGEHDKAIALLQPAAEAGNADAQLFLAHVYRSGKPPLKDEELAFHWYLRAAEQGYPEAQYEVGLMYEVGIGVESDQAEADFWYERAIGQGFCPGELDPLHRILTAEPPLPGIN